ncbi:MAG: NAD(P)H-dependent oxidoreductase, partial [Pseudomonadota bacterium]
MARLIVYYAHPGHRHSRVNRAMSERAQAIDGITFIDLYALYPRHDIDIAGEQARVLDADVILF